MKVHQLKIDLQPLHDLKSGAKTCEVRNDDRGFEVGDKVMLGAPALGEQPYVRKISHVQRGYGLPDGLCVLSYAPVTAPKVIAALERAGNLIEQMAQAIQSADEMGDYEQEIEDAEDFAGELIELSGALCHD